jgi:hypothetical protein
MRLSILGFFLLLLVADTIPVAVGLRRIVGRARRAGIAFGPHATAAVFGGLCTGLLMNGLAVQTFLFGLGGVDPVPFRWQQVVVLAGGLLGSAAAVGSVWLHLRMVTQRDPDYEEPRDPPVTRR